MEYETYADVIDAYNADNMGYSTLTDYIKGQNIKIKEIEMDPIGDMQKIFENKADGGSIGIEVLFKEKMKEGGRVGLFMGGDPLTGQALQIYNSMKGYNFSDQEIADALSARGLYTAPGSGTTTTAPEGIIGVDIQERGGGFNPFGPLKQTFTRPAGSDPSVSEDAFFGLGKFLQGKERGTLGTRLAAQKPIVPLPSFAAAYSRSPFNPDSPTYNPDFVDQLNFLELGDDMIGMSNVGLKYGSGSVLRGQNVISGFGSNDYLTQLNKYINRKNITDKARQRGINERRAFLEAQERKRDAAFQAQLNEQQRQQRQADLGRISRAYREETGGQGGSYSTGQSGVQADGSYNDPFDPGGGEKDGGLIGYNKGGLATMFTRRR